MSTLNSRFFWCARIQIRLTRSLNMELISYWVGTISILPDSSLERSRMSFIVVRSILLAFWMLMAFSAISSEMSSLRIISFKPMIVLMGVRISWLMLAKNVSFERAICSTSFFCASADFFSCS